MWGRTQIDTSDRVMRIMRRCAAAAALLSLLAWCPRAHAANAVLEWNQIALGATVTAGQGPLPQIRSMAIVHVSMHDAVNRITRDHGTYLDSQIDPSGASPDAAAIGAAHRALVTLFPPQADALNSARTASLAARGLSESDPGVALGAAVAAALLSQRSNDGFGQAQFPYTAPGAGTPGVWVPVGAAAPITPGWGNVATWVIKSGSDYRPDGPPSLGSRRYARDYDEVKELGSLTSATRTSEQTEIGRFWLGSPTAIWNGVARQIIAFHDLDLSSTARVLALLYLAGADASIACWDAKYVFNFWRPITAIQQGDMDGNDATLGHSTWAPLFPTPQHPEYVSGHSTNSSAMATVLKIIFGDKLEPSVIGTSPTNPGFERHWETLSEGVDEVIDARVFSGIHFRTSNEEGARVGRAIARYIVSHELRPRHRK